jgi:hypothetical protein
MISVIVPVSSKDFENGLLFKAQYFIERAQKLCLENVETVAVINDPSFGRVKAKNYGAEQARGETLVFLDVDCFLSSNFLNEVSQKSKNEYFVGGGVKYVRLSRHSFGINCWLSLLAFYMILKQITLGAFWIRAKDFKEMGGFREKKLDDIDFAVRLQKLAKKTNRKFESIKESFLIWSTRKFDVDGDWHWIRGYHSQQITTTTITSIS